MFQSLIFVTMICAGNTGPVREMQPEREAVVVARVESIETKEYFKIIKLKPLIALAGCCDPVTAGLIEGEVVEGNPKEMGTVPDIKVKKMPAVGATVVAFIRLKHKSKTTIENPFTIVVGENTFLPHNHSVLEVKGVDDEMIEKYREVLHKHLAADVERIKRIAALRKWLADEIEHHSIELPDIRLDD